MPFELIGTFGLLNILCKWVPLFNYALCEKVLPFHLTLLPDILILCSLILLLPKNSDFPYLLKLLDIWWILSVLCYYFSSPASLFLNWNLNSFIKCWSTNPATSREGWLVNLVVAARNVARMNILLNKLTTFSLRYQSGNTYHHFSPHRRSFTC